MDANTIANLSVVLAILKANLNFTSLAVATFVFFFLGALVSARNDNKER
jgi:hypothetical protein